MLMLVTAQVFCLSSNFRLKDRSRDSWNREPLKSEELQRAENIWIRAFQEKYFFYRIGLSTVTKESVETSTGFPTRFISGFRSNYPLQRKASKRCYVRVGETSSANHKVFVSSSNNYH